MENSDDYIFVNTTMPKVIKLPIKISDRIENIKTKI